MTARFYNAFQLPNVLCCGSFSVSARQCINTNIYLRCSGDVFPWNRQWNARKSFLRGLIKLVVILLEAAKNYFWDEDMLMEAGIAYNILIVFLKFHKVCLHFSKLIICRLQESKGHQELLYIHNLKFSEIQSSWVMFSETV